MTSWVVSFSKINPEHYTRFNIYCSVSNKQRLGRKYLIVKDFSGSLAEFVSTFILEKRSKTKQEVKINIGHNAALINNHWRERGLTGTIFRRPLTKYRIFFLAVVIFSTYAHVKFRNHSPPTHCGKPFWTKSEFLPLNKNKNNFDSDGYLKVCVLVITELTESLPSSGTRSRGSVRKTFSGEERPSAR